MFANLLNYNDTLRITFKTYLPNLHNRYVLAKI